MEPFGYKGLGLKIGINEYRLTLPNSIGCYRVVSSCCFCCQNIFSVSVGVATNVTVSSYFSQEFDKSDGTKRSIYSSFYFKLRRHKACAEADGYNEESWHKRTDQNDQRQGNNDCFVEILTIYHPSHHFW